MSLTYKYRLRPSKRQHAALAATLESQRQLYNGALEERIGAYRTTGKGRTYFDQCKALTECRRDLPEMSALPVALQRWTLKRLDDAYGAFFRRLKGAGRAGFPRFRGKGRWDSFGFCEMDGLRFDGARLRFKGMSSALRVSLHRQFPVNADIRSCVFRRDAKGWAICFQIALRDVPKRPVDGTKAIGIDLGLKVFAYQSDGIVIAAPQFSRSAEREMRRRARALARCRRGSNRRRKVKARLVKLHERIVNSRATWLHQHSARIARAYDLIAVEDLNVAGMMKNHSLARSISDASWSKFLGFLAYKAEKAGGHFVRVNPRNTSQKCSGCGELVPKSLAVRTHSCPHCGLVIDRDWNASLNILAAVVSGGAGNVTRQSERRPGNLKHLETRP